MRVLVACEFSGIVRDAFRARGHDAWSCDLEPCERGPRHHIQGDVLEQLGNGWDLMIAHPPCDFLTNSGNRWLYEACSRGTPEQRKKDRDDALQFFLWLKMSAIPKIAIENPTPHPYVIEKVGMYQQRVQPWEFGEKATKGVCLWLKNLPPLMATIIETGDNRKPECWLESPGPKRKKNRSRTYPGIAAAMAEQWGSLPIVKPPPMA